MGNIDEFYGSTKWLKAEDLKGREVKVTIEFAEKQTFNDGSIKLGLKFVGKEKGLLLNKTNAVRISDAYGKDFDAWDGRELFLYPDKVQFNGQMVDCVRVRVPIPQAENDEAIPF